MAASCKSVLRSVELTPVRRAVPQGCHGGRPVTLIGCSMGARLVFHCLLELSRLGLRGCVENVILLGAPLSCRPDRWCAARSVVAGRLINGYR